MGKSSSSSDILHFGAVRLRVTGAGILEQSLRSLDDINIVNMSDLDMQAATNREPLTLTNYIDQRGQYKLGTVRINETFEISKIVIFVKQLYTGYPQ